MKKFIVLLLTLAITLSLFSVTAFAEESYPNGIPENATRHTIEVTLRPEESITPFVWGDPSITMVDNHTAYTGSFYLSDRYFAYEMQGFLEEPGATSTESYSVILEHTSGGMIASMSGLADGATYKKDWITINVDGTYRFRVVNNTDYTLTVYMTYYSWN